MVEHRCLLLLKVLHILGIFTTGDSSKILIYPNDLQSNAQFKSLVTLAETLAERHDVTLLMNSRVVSGSYSQNVTVVTYALPGGVALPEQGSSFLQPELTSSFFSLVRTERLHTMLDICEALLKRQYLMIQLQLQEFDLIFADINNICARVLIDYLQIPSVAWCYNSYDISCEFSTDFTTMAVSQDVITRFRHALTYVIYTNLYQSSFICRPFDILQHRYGYNRGLSVSDTFSRNKPLILLNADFSVDMPRPVMPFVIPIAGLAIPENRALSHDVEDFIASSGMEGFIFVHLALTESLFFQKQLSKILDALKNSDRHVLVEDGSKIGVNYQRKLKTVSSAFHGAILSHKKLALFITGCSGSTIHDVVYYSHPAIYLSSFGDTDYCRTLFERHRIGKVLDVLELNAIDIEKEITISLDLARYKNNTGKLSAIFKHQVRHSKERLWHWIDFVCMHKGVENLYNSSLQIKWYQYGMLDLLILLLLGTIILSLVFFKVASCIIEKVVKLFWPRHTKCKSS